MSRTCGACNKPCGTAHECEGCNAPLHSCGLCEDVWMPEEGKYFCGPDCVNAYNENKTSEYEAWKESDEYDAEADDGSVPNLFEVRKRPDAPIHDSLPRMTVTRHKAMTEGDGTRGFKPGIADSRGAAGPTSPLGRDADGGPHRETHAAKQRAQPDAPRRQAVDAEATANEIDDKTQDLLNTPWLGAASSLADAGKLVLKYYEHRNVLDNVIKDGKLSQVPFIKYKTTFEPATKERTMKSSAFNPSRLGDYLINSQHTPAEVKEKVARKMKSTVAKEYVKQLDRDQKVAEQTNDELLRAAKMHKTDGGAQARADARHGSIERYVARDAAMPPELYSICFHLMAVFILMCRLSFGVVGNAYFLRFLWALRPNFAKQLPAQARKILSGSALDEVYEEAQEIATDRLDQVAGRPTLGIDGHKEGRRRHVETITKAKLGISVFAGAQYMKTKRATGENLASVALKYLTANFIAIVADNTGNNLAMFAVLLQHFATLFTLGCFVHVLDLLIEDIAKLPKLAEIGNDAHFVIAFIKRHGLLYEEFLHAQQRLGIRCALKLYPETRFGYLYLMLVCAYKNKQALRLVTDSAVFSIVLTTFKKRGKESEKAVAEFKRFRDLVDSSAFYKRLAGGRGVLEPLSMGLHYGEGDKVPLSHIYAVFQTMYDFSQQLNDFDVITDFLEEEEQDEVTALVRERWLGTSGQGSKVGLKADVHLLAFAIDPYVQAAMTSPETVTCDLMDGHVTAAARRALRHFSKDDPQKRALLEEQFMLWMAATPARKSPSSQPQDEAATTTTTSNAVPSGNNAFSSLRLAAMETTWEKIKTNEEIHEVPAVSLEDEPAAAMGSTISKLKQCSNPVTFWLTMMQETPRGANGSQLEAHRMFCRSMSDISAIVGHTCGVERAGKAYGLVMSSLRKSMDPVRAIKSVYIYANYPLLEFKHELGDGYDAFSAMMSNQAEGNDGENGIINHDDVASPHTNNLRRGRRITEDTRSSDESDESEEGDDGGTGRHKPDPVAWSMPEQFTLGPEPSKLDSKLIGSHIYMRWKEYGWQLGKVYDQITSSNPRLFKKFNYRVVWADNRKGPASLRVENYAHGPDAALDSWVVLLRKRAVL